MRDAPEMILNDISLMQDWIQRACKDNSRINQFGKNAAVFIMRQLYTLWRWASYGLPTFDLTESSVARFILTGLSGLSFGESCLPFRSFMLRLPVNHGIISLGAGEGIRREVRWIHVCLMRVPKTDEDLLKARLCMRPHELKNHPGLPTGPYRSTEEFYFIAQTAGSLAIQQHIPVTDETPCEAIIKSRPRMFEQGIGWLPMDKEDYEAQESIIRLVFNASLYAAHVRSDRQRFIDRSHEKACQHLGLPQPAVWILGKAIPLDANLKEAAASHSEPGRMGYRVRSRFIVRGHWRNQSCGRQHSERRMRWIQPFWKGPKDARAAIMRLYQEGHRAA